MDETIPAPITTLNDLVPSWAKEAQDSKTLIQFFVSFFDFNDSRSMAELNGRYTRFSLQHDTFLRVIELADLKVVLPTVAFAKPRTGPLHWYNHIEERQIEPGVYAVLGAPFGHAFGSTEADAREALSSLSAALSLIYGVSAIYKKKFEIVLDTHTGQYSVSTPVFENPAFFQIDHARDMLLSETFDFASRLTSSSEEVRALVRTSLTYVDRAIRDENHGVKLSLYISALEVLAEQTSTNAVCKLLQVSHARLRGLGYDDLLSRRNAFVHRGRAVHLKRREERLLQYVIIDAISGKVGLVRTNYAEQYCDAEKFDG
jgi:hypothetical protein